MQTEIVPPFTEERIAAENREVRAYVRCMRAWVERSRSLALGGPVPCGAADTRRLRRARGPRGSRPVLPGHGRLRHPGLQAGVERRPTPIRACSDLEVPVPPSWPGRP